MGNIKELIENLEKRFSETEYRQKIIENDMENLKFRMNEFEKSKLQIKENLLKLNTIKNSI